MLTKINFNLLVIHDEWWEGEIGTGIDWEIIQHNHLCEVLGKVLIRIG